MNFKKNVNSDQMTDVHKMFHLKYRPLHFMRKIEYRIVLDWLNQELCDNNPRILDIACGIGELDLKIAMRHTGSIIGIDFMPKYISYAERDKKFYSNIINNDVHFLIGDAQQLPFVSNSFDIIISNCALEHFKDDEKALIEMHRLLRNGGKLILTVDALPGRKPIMDPISKLPKFILKRIIKTELYNQIVSGKSFSQAFQDYRCLRHNIYHFFTEKTIEEKSNRCGFEIIESKRYLDGVFSALFFELYTSLKGVEFSNRIGRCIFPFVYFLCLFEPFKMKNLRYGLAVYAMKRN